MIGEVWTNKMDQILQQLQETNGKSNWALIAQQVSQKTGQSVSALDCRNRYLSLSQSQGKTTWNAEEEKQLWELHNQYGNRWTTISQHLAGRNENSIKNHFYSRMRKSLRTLNKVAKSHFKKTLKPVGEGVIYKLTEATDEGLKEDSQLSKHLTDKCQGLKNKLLQYDCQKLNQHNLEEEEQMLKGLADFNKTYKKQSKKERITLLGTQNLKKGRETKKQKALLLKATILGYPQSGPQSSSHQYNNRLSRSDLNSEPLVKQQFSPQVIKLEPIDPSWEDLEDFSKSQTQYRVEDILRAEGIIENIEYGCYGLERKENSANQGSNRQEQDNPDMFGESEQFNEKEFAFPSEFRQLSQAGDSCQISYSVE